MNYHDNEVTLAVRSGYSLIGGSYTVEDFSVTDGQDPKGRIHIGLTVSFSSDGRMSFSVGRSGSDQVAKWFNDRIPEPQNTFDHDAGALNFAFLGTLEMTITGGIFGSSRETFKFSRITLAQGQAGTSNNWWFGGQHCFYIQNNQVSCKGVNSKGSPFYFVFLRGGNHVNVVEVTAVEGKPKSVVDTSEWMSEINDSRTLDQLVLPGSHDTGMSKLSHCNPAELAGPYTQTQSGSMGAQLVSGARYFDIRVDYDHQDLVTYHRTGAHGCNGQSLRDVLDQTREFLTAHRAETAILRFSHIRDYDRHNPADTKQKINSVLNDYRNLLYTSERADTNLAEARLMDARGRMVLVFNYDEFIDPSTGRFRYMNGSTMQPGSNFTVYDKYSDTADYHTMESGQLKEWKDHAGGLGAGHFFLLSWTLTSSNPPITPSISSLASIANSHLPGVLRNEIVLGKARKPNIVYIDFVTSTVCESIILYNFD